MTTLEKIDELTDVATILYQQKKNYSANIIAVQLQKLYAEARAEKAEKRNEDIRMLLMWASKLVGNQSMVNEYACQKWQESYDALVDLIEKEKG